MEAQHPKYFWHSFMLAALALIINGVFGYLNWLERSQMRAEQQMTRTMLNARATVQQTSFNALKRAGLLSPQEIEEVYKLWVPAEYDTEKRTR